MRIIATAGRRDSGVVARPLIGYVSERFCFRGGLLMSKVNRITLKREKRQKVHKLTTRLDKASPLERERLKAKIQKITHRLPVSV